MRIYKWNEMICNKLVVQTYFIRYFIYSVILSISLFVHVESRARICIRGLDTRYLFDVSAIEKMQSRGCSIETNDWNSPPRAFQSSFNRPRSSAVSLSFHSHSRLFLPSTVASVGEARERACVPADTPLFCNRLD